MLKIIYISNLNITCQEKTHLYKSQELLFPLNSVITLESDNYFRAHKLFSKFSTA